MGDSHARSICEELAHYVQSELLTGGAPIDAETPLLSSGLLDSYSVVELIAWIEERFSLRVAPRWHRLEHFDTLERIAATIAAIEREDRARGPG